MGAKDEPERFVFMRGGKDPGKADAETQAAWVSTATTPEQKLKVAGLSEQQEKLKAFKNKSASGMRPGITRRGKPIEHG